MSVETCLPSDDGTSGAVPNMSSAPYRDILVEISEVSHITINRPERLNALAMTRTDQELSHALEAIEQSEQVRVVILTGSGSRAFCAGWDLEVIGEVNLLELEKLVRGNLALFLKIWNLRCPVIAAINGYALGAGASLALACDLAIAGEAAKLGEPEIRHGALSPFPVLPFFTAAKPLHAFYYFGDPIGADEMLRLGLVNKVVPDAELARAARAYAERLAKVPSDFVQMTKRSLRASYDILGLSNAMRQHALTDTLAIGSKAPDQQRLLDILAKQGMRAFLEARDGPFRSPT